MLAERGLKSTFFVVGEQLRAHRALVERAHAEGHDAPGAAADRLEEFLDRAASFTFVQAPPEDCVPIRRGRVVSP